MGNERVDFLNTTLAGKITKKLYAEQKTQTNVIKANVWNDFIGKIKTGNTIQNEISLENAVKSITKYAVLEANRQKRSADEVAKDWFNLMGLELSNKTVQKVLEKVEEQVQKKEDAPKEAVKEEQNLQSASEKKVPNIKIDEACNCEEAYYDEDGKPCVNRYDNLQSRTLLKTTHYFDDVNRDYDEEFVPGTDKVLKTTDYIENKPAFTNIHNDKQQWTKQINYRENGTVESVNIYNPEKTGEIKTKEYYKEDGKTLDYDQEFFPGTKVVFDETDYIDGKPAFSNLHDKNGHWVEQVNYKDDGSCVINTYDPNHRAKVVSTTHYAEDGVTIIE